MKVVADMLNVTSKTVNQSKAIEIKLRVPMNAHGVDAGELLALHGERVELTIMQSEKQNELDYNSSEYEVDPDDLD